GGPEDSGSKAQKIGGEGSAVQEVGGERVQVVGHPPGQGEGVRGGRVAGVRDGDDAHAGRGGGAQAVAGVLDGHAVVRVDAEPPGRLQVAVGGGLAAGHLLGGDGGVEAVVQFAGGQHGVDEPPG